jgi:hypothetical protein
MSIKHKLRVALRKRAKYLLNLIASLTIGIDESIEAISQGTGSNVLHFLAGFVKEKG